MPKATPLDEMGLTLQTPEGLWLGSSASRGDNKARVSVEGIEGHAVQWALHGLEVSANTDDCGAKAMKVYYAYFFEGGQRDN